MYEAVNVIVYEQITEDEMDDMIAELDTDGTGTVDYEGIYNFLMSRFYIASVNIFLRSSRQLLE